jgi:hypothetical protein
VSERDPGAPADCQAGARMSGSAAAMGDGRLAQKRPHSGLPIGAGEVGGWPPVRDSMEGDPRRRWYRWRKRLGRKARALLRCAATNF